MIARFRVGPSLNRRLAKGRAPTPSADLAAQHLAMLVAQARLAAGLPALRPSEVLAGCAAIRAREIVQHFAHDRPQGTLFELALELGQPLSTFAENIAMVYATTPIDAAANVHRLLMDSPCHHRNIKLLLVQLLGVGASQQGNKWYFVEVFGAQR